jgi:hypothetical protein
MFLSEYIRKRIMKLIRDSRRIYHHRPGTMAKRPSPEELAAGRTPPSIVHRAAIAHVLTARA